MGFLSPTTFLWFLPLGAAIVLLYLLKLKRKERVVSSVMLWAQAVQDLQANAPFQKLKRNLLLFIQIAALLLAVAALAIPFSRAVGLEGQNVVLIIDSSASMKATDVPGGRCGQAKSIALKTIDGLGKDDAMMIISAASKTRVESSFSSDKKALAATIQRIDASDTRANLREAMVLASSLVAKKKQPQIVIISDGAFAKIPDFHASGAQVNFVKVGKRAANVGILAMDSRKTLSGVQQVLVAMRNYAEQERKFNLEFYIGDTLADVREQSLPGGGRKIEIFDLPPGTPGGMVRAAIDVKDDLAADNQAIIFLEQSRRISALLISKGNVFLERALNLDPRTEVVRTPTPPADLARYDLVVFDRVKPPAALPRGCYMLIDSYSPGGPALAEGSISNPTIVDWDKNHPAMKFVGFEGVGIQTAKKLKPMSWGKVVLEAEQGPLAVAGEFEGRKFLVLGFDLERSNFVMVPGFPILIANCLDWFTEKAGQNLDISARTGEPVAIDVPPDTRSITITAPNGSSRELQVNTNPVYYDGTNQAGIYKVQSKGVNRRLAVNLLWAEESDTKPREQVQIGQVSAKASTDGVKTNKEYWRYVLLALLVVLSAGWYIYHRRL